MFSLSIYCAQTFNSAQIQSIMDLYPHLIDPVSMINNCKDDPKTLSAILSIDIPRSTWSKIIEKYSDNLNIKLAILRHIPAELHDEILPGRPTISIDEAIRQYEAVQSGDISKISTFEWDSIVIHEILGRCSSDFINEVIKSVRNTIIPIRLVDRLSPGDDGLEMLFTAFRLANIYEILDRYYARSMGEGYTLESLLI